MITILPGVFDLLPLDPTDLWRSSYIWAHVEAVARECAKNFGFSEIRTPMFEKTELFIRGVGDSSDIITKETYTFEDRGKRSITLRPEGTAPVMRSFIENHLAEKGSFHKLFYIAPMFRYERQQAGRFRQHHQFGVEVIGVSGPEQDAEVIALLFTFYQRLGLKNLGVQLNSIGRAESRARYRTALLAYLEKHYESLSLDSQKRFEMNPLRILDSKDLGDQKILEGAPLIGNYLSDEEKAHAERVKECLKLLNIPFEVNQKLVRGLDYYNETVFEVVALELGAQNSIGAGGRYDGLIKNLGGKDLPSVGFGTGLERVIQTLIKQGANLPKVPVVTLYIVPLGEMALNESIVLTQDLRNQGISVQLDLSGKKLAKSLQVANDIGAKFALVLGEDELLSKNIELKEMKTGLKHKTTLLELVSYLKE